MYLTNMWKLVKVPIHVIKRKDSFFVNNKCQFSQLGILVIYFCLMRKTIKIQIQTS